MVRLCSLANRPPIALVVNSVCALACPIYGCLPITVLVSRPLPNPAWRIVPTILHFVFKRGLAGLVPPYETVGFSGYDMAIKFVGRRGVGLLSATAATEAIGDVGVILLPASVVLRSVAVEDAMPPRTSGSVTRREALGLAFGAPLEMVIALPVPDVLAATALAVTSGNRWARI